MPDFNVEAAAEQLITDAAYVVHAASAEELGVSADGAPAPVDYAAVRALAARGMLAPVELFEERKRRAPRVFFPGDTIPGGVWTVAEGPDGRTTSPSCSPGPRIARFTPKLEVFMPTLPQFHAAVERARAEREEAGRG
ncbi:hypothetical protein [Amycolatopsis sp. NPDC004378]